MSRPKKRATGASAGAAYDVTQCTIKKAAAEGHNSGHYITRKEDYDETLYTRW